MKVVFITNKSFIEKSNFGGAQCAKRNYMLLTSLYGKENIKYIIMSDEIMNPGIKKDGLVIKLNKNNIIKYINLLFWRDCFSKKTYKVINEYIRQVKPDIVFFDGSSFGFIGKKISGQVKKVVFYHNIETRYAWSRVINTSPICIVKFFSFWLNERFITKNSNIRICLNKRDENLLFEYYKTKANLLLPITLSDVGEKHISKDHKTTNTLLFVGSYFMPNVKGIKWFCKKVMPYVDKNLLIVGKNMELLRSELEASNISVVGTVDNVEEYYWKADAIIMPIFVGDGMKVKTAEAMMYGKPIFATNEALEGYEIKNIEGIYRCNSEIEFISEIKKQSICGYNPEIRELFLEKYCTQSKQIDFENLMSKIYDY